MYLIHFIVFYMNMTIRYIYQTILVTASCKDNYLISVMYTAHVCLLFIIHLKLHALHNNTRASVIKHLVDNDNIMIR